MLSLMLAAAGLWAVVMGAQMDLLAAAIPVAAGCFMGSLTLSIR